MPIPIDFLDQNPWWRNPQAIEEDRLIAARRDSKIPWDPRIKYKFIWNKDIIYTLRGPRQVGKSTLIKDIIRDLLRSGVDAKRIFYYTCDLVDNPKNLADTVTRYVDATRADFKERLYVLLDETSSVRDWQKAIKHLVDTGKLRDTTVILTGSHTLDIKKAYEKLPGRRGVGEDVPDKILLPMKFSEYVETLSPDVTKVIGRLRLFSWHTRRRCLQGLTKGELLPQVQELLLYTKELDALFGDYLVTGGIPKVIDEYRRKGSIPEEVYKTYVDFVIGDLQRWNKRASYLRQIVNRVFDTLGNPVGWSTLKQDTDIASHNTVAEYIDTLRDMFVTIYLHQFDISRSAPAYQKEKRLHFHDPFFLHSLRAWVKGGTPFDQTVDYFKNPQNAGYLAESVVADHLIRCAFALSRQKSLFDYENVLFYWRSKKNREVDFILGLNGEYVPIEVKYQSRIGRSDRFGVIDFLKSGKAKSGILLTKGKSNVQNKILEIPIPVFLTLI